ncbi:Hypothetical protein BCAN_B1154 [Brucella canis ATCC 23365]|uniref:Uncharacterized protein n=1 Tax=Brucella canis (strain ATCC 23365 / NCTC 10854 / RM-666) TaxID=483179 RepID=A9MD46_BRUC2|nr:Hypothetical protein BCAN_B1154 [Brucella canis ATCC 23365]
MWWLNPCHIKILPAISFALAGFDCRSVTFSALSGLCSHPLF